MKLYFFTGIFKKPTTGGEICNIAICEAAEKSGFSVEVIETEVFRQGRRKLIATNIHLLKKVLSLPNDALLMFDFGQLPLFFMGILINSFYRRKKVIGILYHYAYWDSPAISGKILQFLSAFFLSPKIDILFTISNFSRNSFLLFSKKKIPVHIIPPFIEKQLQPPFDSSRSFSTVPRFLHVGTIQKRKNIHNTLKALSTLEFDFIFDIVGKWETEKYKKKLLSLINRFQLSSKIVFHGRLDDASLSALFEQATLFLMVSEMEGYGMAFTDAMKYGLPIVASDKGAIPEVVSDGINGLLSQPHDYKKIALSIRQLCDDKTLFSKIRFNNYKKYSAFTDRKHFLESYITIFKSIKNDAP